MPNEQRKYVRFLSKYPAYAALGPNYVKVGKIKDISIGGLSFTYITSDEISSGCINVNIMLSKQEFNLTNLPCKIAYEVPLYTPIPNYTYMTNYITKQCGITFNNLSNHQTSKLNQLIENYTR